MVMGEEGGVEAKAWEIADAAENADAKTWHAEPESWEVWRWKSRWQCEGS